MDKPICQSCAMPMEPTEYGTNQDGSANTEYCKYCYENGAFSRDETLEEMIASCVPFMATPESGLSEEQARAMLNEQLPKLKRWAK